MKGFFTNKQTQSVTRPRGKVLSCISCGLYTDAKSPKMKPFGNFKKGIMNIGTAPGMLDDMRGKQWQDKDGSFLRKIYSSLGIDLFDDCINLYATNCAQPTPGKGNPNNHQIDCCRRIVMSAIKRHKPKVIILFGQQAVQSVIGGRWKKDIGTINKWNGWVIPDQELGCWVCPIFSPGDVLRFEKKEMETIFLSNIKQAIAATRKQFPKHVEPNITYLDADDLSPLNSIKKKTRLVAFDYETTGLKPHLKAHKLVCASVALNDNDVCAFMLPNKRGSKLPLINLLKDTYIYKMAHNMKYEDTWTFYKLHGTKVENWYWDSLQAAHILDQRSDITGLKFQTYVHFGIIDYDSEIEPFLRGLDDKNANSLNRVLELVKTKDGAHKLLKYCALDSIYEYRLAMIQQNLMGITFPEIIK